MPNAFAVRNGEIAVAILGRATSDEDEVYELIPAEEKHLDQIVPLLFETGYYDYVARDNKLHLAPMEFEKIQTLKPYLAQTYVLMEKEAGKVIGFFTAATKDQVAKVERETPNWYRDDVDIKKFCATLSRFYIDEALSTDFVLFGIAIHSNYRGNGFFRVLWNHLNSLAVANACTSIVFAVWESSPALEIYRHYGVIEVDVADLTNTGFRDKLLKCAFSVSPA